MSSLSRCRGLACSAFAFALQQLSCQLCRPGQGSTFRTEREGKIAVVGNSPWPLVDQAVKGALSAVDQQVSTSREVQESSVIRVVLPQAEAEKVAAGIWYRQLLCAAGREACLSGAQGGN